jgi:hypothetical protein
MQSKEFVFFLNKYTASSCKVFGDKKQTYSHHEVGVKKVLRSWTYVSAYHFIPWNLL